MHLVLCEVYAWCCGSKTVLVCACPGPRVPHAHTLTLRRDVARAPVCQKATALSMGTVFFGGGGTALSMGTVGGATALSMGTVGGPHFHVTNVMLFW